MEHTVSGPFPSLAGIDVDAFPDCPFLGSRYTPVSDASRNLVVRTYFAVLKDTPSEQFVIKCVERGRTCSPAVLSELAIHHQSHGHPYIASLKDVFLTQQYLCIAMSYAPGYDLDTILKTKGRPLTEDAARSIFQQLLLAVKYLHDSGFINRDIRTNNIIFDERSGQIKLQDFMYSRHDQINSDPRDAFKSLAYTSPELLSGASKADIGESANIWELGVCLYKLVTGKFPFERDGDGPVTYRTVPIVISRISKVEYRVPAGLSDALGDLLSRIFVVNVGERMGLDDIMAHPWVNASEWPATMQTIADAMRVTCPVSKEVLDGVSQGARQPGMGRANTTRSTEDQLIDEAAAAAIEQDWVEEELRGAVI